MNKRDLIYQAASEGVMRSRLELYRYLEQRVSPSTLEAVDKELYLAMNRAGDYALKAYDADARKIASLPHLLNPTDKTVKPE